MAVETVAEVLAGVGVDAEEEGNIVLGAGGAGGRESGELAAGGGGKRPVACGFRGPLGLAVEEGPVGAGADAVELDVGGKDGGCWASTTGQAENLALGLGKSWGACFSDDEGLCWLLLGGIEGGW